MTVLNGKGLYYNIILTGDFGGVSPFLITLILREITLLTIRENNILTIKSP